MRKRIFFTLCCLLFAAQFVFSQKNDTATLRKVDSAKNASPIKDTSSKRKHTPRGATLRSAILPGWGQVYNKKYWKVPLVYGALGVTAGVFNFNRKQYNKIKFAYTVLLNKDTANYKNVDPELKPFIEQNAVNSLRNNRNEFRKSLDYNVLFFLLFWGLNVVDATVDGHLKGFDVGDDLSLHIKPGYSAGANTAGISFVFDIHKGKPKLLTLPQSR